MRLENGQPEKETAEKNRQAQAEKAAEVHASQEEVSFFVCKTREIASDNRVGGIFIHSYHSSKIYLLAKGVCAYHVVPVLCMYAKAYFLGAVRAHA